MYGVHYYETMPTAAHPPTCEPGVHRNSGRREGCWVPPCGGCRMNTPPTIEVICPCCQARLSIDLGLEAVIHHEATAKATPTMDLKEALGALKSQANRREAQFQQALAAERGKGKVLERKFE